nr:hypothetical protein [Pseudonocardia sp. AL041005-10]
MRPPALPTLVRPQRRHRAVQDDRRGQLLPAGEHVLDRGDAQPLGAQHGVGLEHLDPDALRHRRPDPAQQHGHAVAPVLRLPARHAGGGAVDDGAELVAQRRVGQLLEPDPQELLARPVAEALGQLGQPLRETHRAQRLADHPGQPGDDPGAVPLDVAEVVVEGAQPRAQRGDPLGGEAGHLRPVDAADVAVHRRGQGREPRILREAGDGVDPLADLLLGPRPLPRRVADGVLVALERGLGRLDVTVERQPGRLGRLVQRGHDQPEPAGEVGGGAVGVLGVGPGPTTAFQVLARRVQVGRGAGDQLAAVLGVAGRVVGVDRPLAAGEPLQLAAGDGQLGRGVGAAALGLVVGGPGLLGGGAAAGGVGAVGGVQERRRGLDDGARQPVDGDPPLPRVGLGPLQRTVQVGVDGGRGVGVSGPLELLAQLGQRRPGGPLRLPVLPADLVGGDRERRCLVAQGRADAALPVARLLGVGGLATGAVGGGAGGVGLLAGPRGVGLPGAHPLLVRRPAGELGAQRGERVRPAAGVPGGALQAGPVDGEPVGALVEVLDLGAGRLVLGDGGGPRGLRGLGGVGQVGEGGTSVAQRGEPVPQPAVVVEDGLQLGEPGGALGGLGDEPDPDLLGGLLVVQCRVGRHDEVDPGRRVRVGAQRGGGADRDQAGRQQPRRVQLGAGPLGVARVVEQHPTRQVRQPRQHGLPVGGGQLRQVATAGPGGDPGGLQRREDVLDLRGVGQQAAVAERGERAFVATLVAVQGRPLPLGPADRGGQGVDDEARVGVRADLVESEQLRGPDLPGERDGVGLRGGARGLGGRGVGAGGGRRVLGGGAAGLGGPSLLPDRGGRGVGIGERGGAPLRLGPGGGRGVLDVGGGRARLQVPGGDGGGDPGVEVVEGLAGGGGGALGASGVGGAGDLLTTGGRRALLGGGTVLLRRVGGGVGLRGDPGQRDRERAGGVLPGGERGPGLLLLLLDAGAQPRGLGGGDAVRQDRFDGLAGHRDGRRGVALAGRLGRGPLGGLDGEPRGESAQLADGVLQPLRRPGRGLLGLDRAGGLLGGGHRAGLLGDPAGRDPRRGRRQLGARGGLGVAGGGRGGLGVDHRLEPGQRAVDELPLGLQLLALGEPIGVAGDELGDVLRLRGVEHRAEQEVDEGLVGGERERLGGLALAGVHGALVPEQLRVQADLDEVAGPVPVPGLPGELGVGVLAVRGLQALPEGGQGDPAPVVGERQVVEAHPGDRPEGEPGVGQLLRVAGGDVPAPLRHLPGDQQPSGADVHPLADDVRHVLGQHEVLQHRGAGGPDHLAPPGQQDREDQLEQDGLAAAVLQEQHRGRRRPARRRAVERVRGEQVLLHGDLHRGPDAPQVECDVLVARGGRPHREQADPGQLIHRGPPWGGRSTGCPGRQDVRPRPRRHPLRCPVRLRLRGKRTPPSRPHRPSRPGHRPRRHPRHHRARTRLPGKRVLRTQRHRQSRQSLQSRPGRHPHRSLRPRLPER